MEGTEKRTYHCVNCQVEFANGVVIAGMEFCARCSMSPSAIAKAQAEFRKGLKQFKKAGT